MPGSSVEELRGRTLPSQAALIARTISTAPANVRQARQVCNLDGEDELGAGKKSKIDRWRAISALPGDFASWHDVAMASDGVNEGGEFRELVASIHYSPIATIITDNRLPDNPIVDANEAFVQLTGYERDEILGRNCRFLAGPATETEVRTAVRNAIARGNPIVAEIINYSKEGKPFRNALMIAPVRDMAGKIALFVGSQMDASVAEGASGLRAARARGSVEKLAPRLRQVLELMSAGYRNKQIGGVLGIGEKTVKMHRARLKEALAVKTSADAVRIAVEAGLLTSGCGSLRSAR